MRIESAVFILWLWLSTLVLSQTPSASQLIRDVRVFDGEQILDHRSVLIEGGKISQIGGPDLKVANADIIDGRGRSLLPGFIDAHVHLPATPKMHPVRLLYWESQPSLTCSVLASD